MDHYQARQALQEYGIRLRHFIQEASDLIRILDVEGRIVYDPPSTPGMLGYPEHFLIGKTAIDFVHPDDREAVTTAFIKVQNRIDHGIPIAFRLLNADGEYIDAESMAMNFIGVDGIDGFVVITWPVSNGNRVLQKFRAASN